MQYQQVAFESSSTMSGANASGQESVGGSSKSSGSSRLVPIPEGFRPQTRRSGASTLAGMTVHEQPFQVTGESRGAVLEEPMQYQQVAFESGSTMSGANADRQESVARSRSSSGSGRFVPIPEGYVPARVASVTATLAGGAEGRSSSASATRSREQYIAEIESAIAEMGPEELEWRWGKDMKHAGLNSFPWGGHKGSDAPSVRSEEKAQAVQNFFGGRLSMSDVDSDAAEKLALNARSKASAGSYIPGFDGNQELDGLRRVYADNRRFMTEPQYPENSEEELEQLRKLKYKLRTMAYQGQQWPIRNLD
ncbi:MAG TPA: hypothetical protein VFP68_13690 [Burkholderiaceae bacterium]|nr:hypothetical protein [Burkholderiaceae bacterium]